MAENRDITAAELLELLSDDEMIEGGYDREGMVALLLLCRAGLQVLAQELAELRERAEGTWTVMGEWAGDAVVPSGYHVFGADKQPGPDIDIDACELVAEVLRRQAKARCRSVSDGEGPALEQLLAMARHHRLDLIVTHDASGGCEAGWWSDHEAVASAKAPTLTAAVRAATCKLLGLDVPVGDRQLSGSPADLIRAALNWADWRESCDDAASGADAELLCAIDEFRDGATAAVEPRQTCGSCQHWRREVVPATEGGAKPCGLDEEHDPAPRHPDSSCGLPGYYKALETAKTDPAPDSDEQLPGVTQPAANVIRSRGDDDV